jgi:hypothetical protein
MAPSGKTGRGFLFPKTASRLGLRQPSAAFKLEFILTLAPRVVTIFPLNAIHTRHLRGKTSGPAAGRFL